MQHLLLCKCTCTVPCAAPCAYPSGISLLSLNTQQRRAVVVCVSSKMKGTRSRSAHSRSTIGAGEKTENLSQSSEEDSFLPYRKNSNDGYDRRSVDLFRADGYDDDFKEEDLEPALTPDIYSLLYTANVCSPGFFFSAFSKLMTCVPLLFSTKTASH